MVVGATMVFDKYSSEQASQLIGIINSIISSSMAAAPIIGAWITQIFSWRINFVVIFALSLISFFRKFIIFYQKLLSQKFLFQICLR